MSAAAREGTVKNGLARRRRCDAIGGWRKKKSPKQMLTRAVGVYDMEEEAGERGCEEGFTHTFVWRMLCAVGRKERWIDGLWGISGVVASQLNPPLDPVGGRALGEEVDLTT